MEQVLCRGCLEISPAVGLTGSPWARPLWAAVFHKDQMTREIFLNPLMDEE